MTKVEPETCRFEENTNEENTDEENTNKENTNKENKYDNYTMILRMK